MLLEILDNCVISRLDRAVLITTTDKKCFVSLVRNRHNLFPPGIQITVICDRLKTSFSVKNDCTLDGEKLTPQGF